MSFQSVRTIAGLFAGPVLGAAFMFLLFLALISPPAAAEGAFPSAAHPSFVAGK
ncbi:MAG TPA: hypothetical protein VGK37_11965 [Casimicrobiaceae bacterium]|jgi:hypothetical protein